MPPQARIFTDQTTLTIPAFDLGNKLTCAGNGLFWDRKKRMTVAELKLLLDPNIPDEQKDKSLYK
jgi:hypothetical protein